MAIADSLRRLGSTLLSIFGTRLELLAVEVEEEALRLFSLLVAALAALFCLGVALLLAVTLVLVLFWDSHRIPALLAMMGLFGGVSVALALWARHSFRAKPRFLGGSLGELAKDAGALRGE